VTGWRGDSKELEQITNWIVGNLRILPSMVRIEEYQGTPILRVEMARAPVPVALRGVYYRRIGNSTREVPSEEVQRFLLERTGQSWDAIPCDYGLDAISEEAIAEFKALAKPRLPELSPDDSGERVLRNLQLMTQDGRLLRAAIMLFGREREPQRLALTSDVHMGRFKDHITILDDKMFTGNLFRLLNAVMAQFRQYLQVRFEFHKEMGDLTPLQAMQRIEIWDYPLDALREAVANALLHRDYTSTGQITIRVFDDNVVITNPGGLHPDLTIEDLRRPHQSRLRNPLLAQVFYYASIVEKWGSGTTRMVQLCREQELSEPEFESTPFQFSVTFRKDPYTPERLRQLGLSERQTQAVLFAKERGSISNAEYRNLTGVSDRTALRDLDGLAEAGILTRQSKGRDARYSMGVVMKPDKPATNPSQTRHRSGKPATEEETK
jgi:ATP-dependent DNA helicase RecG